jgi:hypothetical protein
VNHRHPRRHDRTLGGRDDVRAVPGRDGDGRDHGVTVGSRRAVGDVEGVQGGSRPPVGPPVGAENPVTLYELGIFMDQAAEPIMA